VNASETALVTMALLLMRLVLPLIVTVFFGLVMNRLVDYWIANTEL
jgi:hypothetical protein